MKTAQTPGPRPPHGGGPGGYHWWPPGCGAETHKISMATWIYPDLSASFALANLLFTYIYIHISMYMYIYIYVILYSISILYDACVSAICMIYEQIYDMISLVSWFVTHKFFHMPRFLATSPPDPPAALEGHGRLAPDLEDHPTILQDQWDGKIKKPVISGIKPPFVDDVPIKTRRFTIAKVPGIISFCDDPPSTQVFLRYFLMENLMENLGKFPFKKWSSSGEFSISMLNYWRAMGR